MVKFNHLRKLNGKDIKNNKPTSFNGIYEEEKIKIAKLTRSLRPLSFFPRFRDGARMCAPLWKSILMPSPLMFFACTRPHGGYEYGSIRIRKRCARANDPSFRRGRCFVCAACEVNADKNPNLFCCNAIPAFFAACFSPYTTCTWYKHEAAAIKMKFV